MIHLRRLFLVLSILLLSGLVACDVEDSVVTETESDSSAIATSVGNSGAAAGEVAASPSPQKSTAGSRPAPEFPEGLDWLNIARPLTLAELRGKVVILEFWTYGCINCLHVIPQLKQLEEKYAEELVVIGVHSAKFYTESQTENIRQIMQRYEVAHPVINDNDFAIWQAYEVQAWPTLFLIDPEGMVFGSHAGEQIYEPFDEVISQMVAEFGDEIDRRPLPLALESEKVNESPLRFPGKVLADVDHNRLFIADSNHNRIVVTDLAGMVLDVIGDGRADLQDGDFQSASFAGPQGLTLANENTLYVADTLNHAIRRVDLSAGLVETVAGTGMRGSYQDFEGPGLNTALNSPWDVLYVDGLVYIAMAGQHQLWQYKPEEQTVQVFAGSGQEELLNGSWRSAGFNQPSGLTASSELLFVADSEASAIRSVDLASSVAGVKTIVGEGLFEFGDADGVADEVRLQHPLGVAYGDGLLYVADTYNHKIKLIDPQAKASSTLFGADADGWRDGTEPLFDEPGGLSLGGDKLYIADTNNHVIRIADLVTKEVSTLVLVDSEGLLTRLPEGETYRGHIVTLAQQTVAPGEGVIQLQVALPEGYKLNDIAPFTAEWSSGESTNIAEADTKYQAVAPSFPLEIPVMFSQGETHVQADLVIYYCEAEAENLCLIEQVRLILPVTVTVDSGSTLTMSHIVPLPPGVDGN